MHSGNELHLSEYSVKSERTLSSSNSAPFVTLHQELIRSDSLHFNIIVGLKEVEEMEEMYSVGIHEEA